MGIPNLLADLHTVVGAVLLAGAAVSLYCDQAMEVLVGLGEDLWFEWITVAAFAGGWVMMTRLRGATKTTVASKHFVEDCEEATVPRDSEHDAAGMCQQVVALANARHYSQAAHVYRETITVHGQSLGETETDLQAFFTAGMLAAVLPGSSKGCAGKKVIEDMRRAGVPRTPQFYEVALRALARKQGFQSAVEVYQELKADKVVPTSETAGCVMTALVEMKDTRAALQLLRDLSKADFVPSIRAYMFLLKPLHAEGDWEAALEVHSDIEMRQAPIDNLCFNVILGAAVRGGRGDLAAELYCQERTSGKRQLLDTVSLNTAALGLLRTKANLHAVALIKQAAEAGDIELNAKTYKLLADLSSKVPAADRPKLASALRQIARADTHRDAACEALLHQARARTGGCSDSGSGSDRN
mmetsp:Transcript_31341/g.81397  ORF Transcript_31341/g.81397 Transcript_31341/m.81397 type:complete len:413 (-) Transcript_31341:30-1268(-)